MFFRSVVLSLLGASSSIAISVPRDTSNSTSNSTAADLVSTSALANANKGCQNSASNRGCWGGGYDINTDYETAWPNTGNIVKVLSSPLYANAVNNRSKVHAGHSQYNFGAGRSSSSGTGREWADTWTQNRS